MHTGKFVLAQLLDWIHPQQFQRCVARYHGDYKVSQFSCWSQFVCMVFAQLTWREGLRDIEACLNSRQTQLYHLGLRGPIHRSTLADANEQRDWRIYADLAQGLLRQARRLYATDALRVELDQAVYALDASVIELGLSLCPWARYDRTRAAVKLHTQLDLRGPLPAAVQITPAQRQEILWLDALDYEAGAFYRDASEVQNGLVSRNAIDWIDSRYRLYLAGEVSERTMCAEMVQMYDGLREDELRAAAAGYFREHIDPSDVIQEAFVDAARRLAEYTIDPTAIIRIQTVIELIEQQPIRFLNQAARQ